MDALCAVLGRFKRHSAQYVPPMATHDIHVQIPKHEVINTDLVVSVRGDGDLLGKVAISRGSIDWTPARNSVNYYRLSLERFDEIMRDYGRAKKR